MLSIRDSGYMDTVAVSEDAAEIKENKERPRKEEIQVDEDDIIRHTIKQ